MPSASVCIGVSDHAGWAVLVAIDPPGRVRDRRRISLKDDDLPALPYHCECQTLPTPAAKALVARVRQSADAHARRQFADMANELKLSRPTLVLREIPTLPARIEERISSHWANARADGVMYREAMARAAADLGWRVAWFNARAARQQAEAHGFQRWNEAARGEFAPPWNRDHEIALAGAMSVMITETDGKNT